MNNKTGRPRNTAGSLYSAAQFARLVDELSGAEREVETGPRQGEREKGEAEKVMRKRLVARDEGLLPSAAPGGGDQVQRVGGLVP